jgi:phage repressor protein C with HTH and peptisase S24 domain
MSTLAERIRLLMKETGATQADLSRVSGVKGSSVNAWLSGKTKNIMPSPAMKLADFYKLNLLWLTEGRGRKDRTEQGIIDLETHPDLFPVKRYDVRPSCGIDGISVDFHEEENELPIFFRRDWLTTHGYKAENLAALKVTGRSMEPSLWEGDLIVINRADKVLKSGAVFAVNHEGQCVIKRLQRGQNGGWDLESDNPDKLRYATEPCTERTGIIGRVVYRQSEIL